MISRIVCIAESYDDFDSFSGSGRRNRILRKKDQPSGWSFYLCKGCPYDYWVT